MLFSSIGFICLFLPITFGLYFFFSRKRLTSLAKGWLVAASLFFYAWWNPVYIFLILGSILFNFIVGKGLGCLVETASRRRQGLLVFGLVCNLAALGYYKYTDFFIANANALFGLDIAMTRIVLPLAISFFTFQQVAFLVDSYKGKARECNLLNYALFVCFFPQLIAGPIVHHSQMMPQFASIRAKVLNWRNVYVGLFIFAVGLVKKVVLADTLAHLATYGFDKTGSLTMSEAWIVSLAYTFQLYFDFSGYTDMAIGIGRMFNITLPQNFNSPYKSLSIQDFWRRWHMTLSRWLRDYLYIPLGGSRRGTARTYVNIFLTFLLAGLWHGAGWTFVLWGGLHGIALMIHRWWKNSGRVMGAASGWLLTFLFVNAAWVLFRALELGDAAKVYAGMAGQSGFLMSAEFLNGFAKAYGHGPPWRWPPCAWQWPWDSSA